MPHIDTGVKEGGAVKTQLYPLSVVVRGIFGVSVMKTGVSRYFFDSDAKLTGSPGWVMDCLRWKSASLCENVL